MEKHHIVLNTDQFTGVKAQGQSLMCYRELCEAVGQNPGYVLRDALPDILGAVKNVLVRSPQTGMKILLPTLTHCFQNRTVAMRTLLQFLL
jgi:hypothetical protein